MAELIAVHQIATRDKKGGARRVIPAGSRFNPADHKGVSEKEWEAMMAGEHPSVRVPDDPAFAAPQLPAAGDVTEGRSPRTDLGRRAEPTPIVGGEDGDDDDDDDGDGEAAEAPKNGRRGRRQPPPEDDDDL